MSIPIEEIREGHYWIRLDEKSGNIFVGCVITEPVFGLAVVIPGRIGWRFPEEFKFIQKIEPPEVPF